MEWSLGYELLWISFFIGAIGVAICYERSATFRYRFKFAVYIGVVSTVGLFLIPFCLFRPKNVRNILMGVPFVRPVNRLLGIQWITSGEEILEKDFPCIVICNHQSMLDVLAIIQLWPTMKKCACIAKQEIFYVFPFGLMAWLCGTIYINRKNPNQSLTTISTSAEQIQREKTKMWIFPEGTRSKENELQPFKKGAFHIAMSHKLPIVPVVISPYSFIDDDKKVFDSGIMKIKVLDPIETSHLSYPDDVSELTQLCHDVMNNEFVKMKAEVDALKEKDKDKCVNTVTANGSALKIVEPHENGHVKEHASDSITENKETVMVS